MCRIPDVSYSGHVESNIKPSTLPHTTHAPLIPFPATLPDHLCDFVISKQDTFLHFGILVDSFFRCMLPVLRSAPFRALQAKQLLYADGIPFTFAVLRK